MFFTHEQSTIFSRNTAHLIGLADVVCLVFIYLNENNTAHITDIVQCDCLPRVNDECICLLGTHLQIV